MSDLQQKNKKLTEQFRKAMYKFNPIQVLGSLKNCFAKDAPIHLATPFETLNDVEEFYLKALHASAL